MTDRCEELCFCLVFYGVTPREGDLVLLSEVDELFSAVDLPTSHLHVSAPGFGRRYLRFGPAWKRLLEAPLERVDSVSLYTMPDGWQSTSDWLVECHLERDESCFILSVGLEHVPDGVERILGFVLPRLQRIHPGYGIGVLRPRNHWTYLFAMGIGYGGGWRYEGWEYEENRLTSRWIQGMNDEVWREGVLRDVYPYNLLTAAHLERDVGGVSLRAWIEAHPWRGRLEQHGAEYALWTVDEAHLLEVRRALAPLGALYVLGPENHLGPPGAPRPD